MDERRKKLLFIFLFILAVVGIAVVLYLLFFRAMSPTNPSSTAGLTGTGNSLPRASDGSPDILNRQTGGTLPGSVPVAGTGDGGEILTLPGNSLLPDAAKTAVLAQNVRLPIAASRSGGNGVRFYDATDGRFYSILDDGTRVPLSDTVFPNVDQVTWGNKSEKAVIGFPDGSQVIYDFAQDKQTTIPRYWVDPQFSPDDDQIAAKSIGNNPSNRFLIIADSDGTDPHPIEELGNNQDKVSVSWSPNNQTVAFSRTGEALGADREQILLVGKNQENFKGLVVEGRGFTPSWSPDGSQLLYSVWSSNEGYRPSLWLSGASGDQVNANRRRMSVETWADKCTWASSTVVVCGVPKVMPDGAGLQRSVFDVGPDTLMKLDLANGQVTPLGDPGSNVVVSAVRVSGDGKSAFVTDGTSGQLIRVRI